MPLFFQRIVSVMEGIGEDFEIVCVNDGSHDGTLSLLMNQAEKDERVCVVDLSRNFGKEAALTAALDHSRGDEDEARCIERPLNKCWRPRTVIGGLEERERYLEK